MSDYSTNASVTLQVNGQQAQETLENLRKSALHLTDEIAKAAAAGDKVTLKKLRRELNDTKRQIKEMESATMQVDAVLHRLDKATPRELQKSLQTLNKQLEYMERGSDAWDAQVQKIKRVKEEIAKVNGELAKSKTFLERFNDKWQSLQNIVMGAAAAFTGAVMAGRSAVKAYAGMDEEIANTRKYTGMTVEEVEKLNTAFKNMSTRTARAELNELAQEAGRLGKTQYDDVMGYVEAADIINVALVDLGDGATQTIAKLSDIFRVTDEKGTKDAMLAVGSTVNVLSQNCTANKQYLVEFAQRMAGIGATAKMTIPEILAFAATLDANGQKCEMSASSLGKLIMLLYKEPTKMAQAVGLDVTKFTETLNNNVTEGVMMFLSRIRELGSDQGLAVLAPLFDELGMDGVRMSQVLATLADKIDMVKWELGEANKAFSEATSATNEYNIFNNTVQAGLDKAKKGFLEMAIALGKELAPIMRHIITSGSATMRLMLKIIQFVKEHRIAILSLSAAIAAYTIVVQANNIKLALNNALTTTAIALKKAWNAVKLMNPWGAIAAAAAAAVTAIVMVVKKKKELAAAAREISSIEKMNQELDEKIASEYQQQASKVDMLVNAIHDETLSLQARKNAIAQLQTIIPEYHADLDEEGRLINENTTAIDNYLKALEKKIQLQIYEDKLAELFKEKMELNFDPEKDMKSEQEIKQEIWQSDTYKQAEQGNPSAANQYVEQQVTFRINLQEAKKGQYDEVMGRINALKERMQEDVDLFSTMTEEEDDPVITPNGDDSKPAKNKFQAEDDWKEKEEALNRIAYAKGEKDYEAYVQRMLQIEVDYHKQKLAHTDLVGNEEVTIEASYQEALKKQKDNAIEGTVEAENQAYREVMAVLQQRYMDGELTARQYQSATELAELEHLRKIYNLYAEGSKERLRAEQAYFTASKKQQQKHLEEDKKLQEKFRQEYFTKAYRTSDTESYSRDLRNLELVQAQMLKACGDNNKQKLKIEKAFQEAKYRLGRKYNVKNAKELKKSYRAAIDDIADWLESDGGQALTGSLETVLSGMSEIFSGISDLIQAELDVETAKIERSYDAQISAAEGNKYQQVQLEQEKATEIAKAKNEANKKMFAMQVIEAVAQTAMSAISAYSSAAAVPVVGYILAPIAAAMAIAAGGIQIANIKKQQQAAAASGYMEGGFTPAGPVDKEVGVVHAGEWVASQKLLADPTARAMVNTLDYAQRTNSIGSLRASDVSQSITAPTVIARATQNGKLDATMTATASAISQFNSTMKEFHQRMNDPFVTVNTVEGDKGIKKAQDEYNQLIRNKTPKSQRI